MSRNKRLRPEEKVTIVRKWKAGKISIRAAGQEAGVALETIRRWIAQYEAEGAAGFLPRSQNRVYPPEMKRQAVMEISKKYQLRSDTQLRDWIKAYNAHGDFNSVKHSGGGSRILDLYDRRIVSFVLRERNDNPFVCKTFDKAVKANPDAHPLFHSDRGFRYTGRAFHHKLQQAGACADDYRLYPLLQHQTGAARPGCADPDGKYALCLAA